MKTWTNPSVEELDVKLTASMDHPFYHERNNGWWDGNKWWGSNQGGNTGDNGNQGGDQGGDEGGNESGNPETSGPNS